MKYTVRHQLTEKERAPLARFSPLVAQLLFHRGLTGITGVDDIHNAEKFLSPDYDRDIHDPFLLKDVEKAADRIILAIKSQKEENSLDMVSDKIAIYADYDADGIPGAALFHDFFCRIGFKNFTIYIPHRHNEGFGLNIEAVEQLAREGVKLVVTVDCGISDILPVTRANQLGMEVIITDHHEAPEILPPAYVIVDHKQPGCDYPEKTLCGSGVAFKLVQAILKKDRLGLPIGHEKWLLDLVGIATLSDMVPLIGENRVFAKYGLEVLRKSQRKGLQQLLSHLRIAQQYLSEDDVAFMITPRINAASRMGVPMDAFNLLSADNDIDALKAAKHLDHINNERKGVVASLVKEIKKILRDRYGSSVTSADVGHKSTEGAVGRSMAGLPAVIVLGNPDWRPSLLGLAANSCAEEFDRPVFLWGRDGGNIIKGSCRSDGKSNVVELMRAVSSGVLTQFGGHKHSGGFAVAEDQVHFLEKHLNDATKKIYESSRLDTQDENHPQDIGVTIDEDDLVDAEISLDAVNWDLYNDIARLAPFGMSNRKPLFLLKNVSPASVRIFGKGEDHVELILSQSNGRRLSAISFFGAVTEWAKIMRERLKGVVMTGGNNLSIQCDIVASLEKSMFRGRPELRLRIEDVIVR